MKKFILLMCLLMLCSCVMGEARSSFTQLKGISSIDELRRHLSRIATNGLSYPMDILLQPGDYVVSSPTIVIPSNVRITGMGSLTTFICDDLAAAFKSDGATNITLKNISFNGQGGTTNVDAYRLLWFVDSSDITVEKCQFQDTNVAVQFTGCSNVSVEKNTFRAIQTTTNTFNGYGVLAEGSNDMVNVNHNVFYGPMRHGIYFSSGTTTATAIANKIKGSAADAITVYALPTQPQCERIVISDNIISDFSALPVLSRQSGISASTNVENITIANNIIDGPRDFGITFEGIATGTPSETMPQGLSVVGNTIEEASTGLLFRLCENFKASDNYIHTANIGIQVTGGSDVGTTNVCTNGTIKENRFSNVATYAATIYDGILNIVYGKQNYDSSFTSAKIDFKNTEIASGKLIIDDCLDQSLAFTLPALSSYSGKKMTFGANGDEPPLNSSGGGLRLTFSCSSAIASGTASATISVAGLTLPPTVTITTASQTVTDYYYNTIPSPSMTNLTKVTVYTSADFHPQTGTFTAIITPIKF